MAFGKITGSVIQDNTITESNLAFGISGQSAATAWATDTLKVNIIESDDSSGIQLNDSLNISGTLSANTIDVNTITSGDSSGININDTALYVNGDRVATVTGTETLENKTLRAPTFESGSNAPEFLETRYVNATQMDFVQLYTGGSSGSYYSQGEYQKIATITPDGNNQNYTFRIRMTATSASNYQIVEFTGALRSNTLPDLDFTSNYFEEHNGTRFIEPKLWTKETTTAGFILAFEYIHNQSLFGGVNVEATIIPRSDAQRANVAFNTTQDSEQSSIDAGFTEQNPTLIYANVSGTLEFGTQFRIEGTLKDNNELTITATDPTADRTITFPDATGTVALTSDITLSTLSVTSTATELNLLDGITGITLGDANETLIVGTDGTSITTTDLLAFDTVNNRVGIGTTSPATKFHIAGEGSANEGQIRLQQAYNGSDGPDFAFYASRGTIASPTSTADNDTQGRINAYVHNGTNFVQSGSFGWSSDGTDGDNTFDIRSRVGGTIDKRIEVVASGDIEFQDGAFDVDVKSHDGTNGLKLGGTLVTSSATELNLLDGVTGTLVTTAGSQTLTNKTLASPTVTGTLSVNTIASADSTILEINDGLRINALSTTNAFLINAGDGEVGETTTLTVDPASNYLGINQTSPEVTLHMTGEGAQSAQIRMEQHNDSGDAPDIRTRKSRGTADSSTKNAAGDFIFRSNHERYNGSAYVTVGQLAVDTNSGNADRFQLTLAVSEDGGSIDAANAQFKIDGNDSGAITFNGAYKFPTTDGSADQILQTNGSGVLTFVDPPMGTLPLGDSSSNAGSVPGGDALEFRAGNSITPTVAGNGVTIALNDAIVVNAISSADSTAIQINDGVNISGTLSANTIDVNTLISSDSTGINIAEAKLFVNGSTVLTLATADDPSQTTSTADVDDVLINDGGVMKRIPLANINISSFNNDSNFASAAGSGFSASTTTSFPISNDSSATDYGEGEPDGVSPESATTDAFGVALGTTFDCMEPVGSTQTTDLGTDEAHVGA